ncbi:hypothetical protein MRX96_028546 [Rhipicephalus microplus]
MSVAYRSCQQLRSHSKSHGLESLTRQPRRRHEPGYVSRTKSGHRQAHFRFRRWDPPSKTVSDQGHEWKRIEKDRLSESLLTDG